MTNRGLMMLRFGFIRRTSRAISWQHANYAVKVIANVMHPDSGCGSEPVLAGADFGEDPVVRRIRHADGGLHRGQSAHAGTGWWPVLRPGSRAWAGGLRGASLPDTRSAQDKRGIVGFKGCREAQGCRSVYSWPEQISVSGGRAASFCRLAHICGGGALEQPPAAAAIRLSAVKTMRLVGKVKGDMADGYGRARRSPRRPRRPRSPRRLRAGRGPAAAGGGHRRRHLRPCTRWRRAARPRPAIWSSW